jgi:hypothetical protein
MHPGAELGLQGGVRCAGAGDATEAGEGAAHHLHGVMRLPFRSRAGVASVAVAVVHHFHLGGGEGGKEGAADALGPIGL